MIRPEVSEFWKEREKKTKTKKNSSYTSSQRPEVSEFWKKREEAKNQKAEADTIGLDSLSTDLSTLGKTISGVYGGWQTPETMANTKASVESMHKRLTAYQEYQNKYNPVANVDFRTTFDDLGVPLSQRALYKSPADYVTKNRNMQTASLVNSYKNILDNWDELESKYSSFKSKEEYDNAVEEYKSKTTANLDEKKAEITDLEKILSKAKEYENKVSDTKKRKAMATSRSRASSTSLFDEEITQAQAEYDEYLASVGYSNIGELETDVARKNAYYDDAKSIQESIALDKKHKEMAKSKEAENGLERFYADEEKAKVEKSKSAEANAKNRYMTIAGNNNAGAAIVTSLIDSKRSDDSYKKPKNDWTQEERLIFGAYYSENPESAYEYATKLNNEKALAEKEDGKSIISDEATQDVGSGAKHTLGAILTAPLGLADYIDDITDIASGRGTIVEEGGVTPFEYSQAVTSGISSKLNEYGTLNEDIPIIGGKGWGDVYGLGTSIAQSGASAVTLGGWGTLVSYFGQGAAAGVDDALSRGATSEQALLYGTILGAAEGVSEKIGVDNLFKLGASKPLKQAFLNVLKQAGAEGGEEMFSSVVGQIADNFVMQDKSNFNTLVNKYLAEGMSVGEAKNKAWLESVGDIAFDTLSGALSGGLHAMPHTAFQTAMAHSYDKTAGASIRSNERVSDMLDVVQNMTPEESSAYEIYTRYAKKGVNADNISDAQLGNLYNTINAETRETLSSKKSTLEQRENANEIQKRLSAIDEKKAISKETIDTIDTAIGITKEYRNAVPDLVSEGLESNKDTQSYKLAEEYKEKLDNGKTLTDEEIFKLAKANEEAIRIEELNDYASVLSPEEAELFKSVYDGNTDVEAFSNAFNLVASYSKGNFTEDYILQHKGVLSTDQVQTIYNAMVLEPRKTLERNLDSFVSNMSKKIKYKSVIDDSIIDYNNSNTDGTKVNWNSLNDRQRSAITFVKKFAEAMGVNLKFYQSDMVRGKRKGKNGSYNPETNTIEIDVYAGIQGVRATKSNKDTIINTFSHELTHWMKAKSPLLYNKISNQVFCVLTKNGKTEEDLIADEIDAIHRRHPKMKDISVDYARDEIIARACEDMLSMSEEGRRIFDSLSKEEKKTFVEKIKAMVSDLIEWINTLLSDYKSDEEEAKFLQEYKEDLLAISKTWDEMLVRSRKTNQALQNEGVLGEQLSEDVLKEQYSERVDNELTDEEYRKNCEELVQMDYVANLIGTELDGDLPLKEKIITLFNSWGNVISTEKFGDVALTNSSIRSEFRHGTTREKVISYAAIPYVLKNGVVIDIQKKNFGNVERIIVAAPITISDTPYFMGVMIQRAVNTNRLYLHDVVIRKEASEYHSEHLNTTGSPDTENLFTTDVLEKAISVGYNIPQSSKKVKEQNSDRYEVSELTDDDYSNMMKHFGVTGNFNVAGYLLKSGHMLDFSGKHWGDTTSRTRQVDHREIQEVLTDESNGVGAMVNMISNGNIRLMPETGGINLAVAPSKNQRTVLRRYIEYMSPKEGIVVDIDEVGGDTIKSFTFDVGTSADAVMRTIDNYFRGGTQSELMRFHTQFSDREESLSTEELYNLMGENEKLKKQKQVLAEDVERLRERLRLESKVTNGEFFSSSQLLGLAGHLRKMANSTIDKVRLAEMLRDATKVISKLDTSNMTPDELFNEHLLPIAYAIAEEGSGQVIKDEYVTSILNGIRSSEIWLSDSQKAEITHMYGGKWNNHLFGKFKLSDNRNNDLESKWQHWAKTYPSIFDAEISEAEMGVRLLEIYDDLKKASEIVSEYNEQEVAMELAKEIYTQCWTFRPIKTAADRYTERIKKLTSEHRQAMKELKDTYEDKVEKQKVADAMYYGRVINNIRTRKDKEIAEAKKIGKERMDKYKDNAERKTRIQRITSNVLDLSRKLIKNSKDQHIPEVMKPIIVELVQALDFSSKRMLDKGVPTQKDISLYKSLERVQQMMSNATSNVEGLEQLYGHNLDDRIAVLVSTAFNTLRDFGDNEFILNHMSAEDLATLDETVRFIKHVVNAVNKFYVAKHSQGVASLSKESVSEMRELGDGKKFGEKSIIGGAVKLLNWKNINPYYAFKRFGEGGRKIFEALQDGWDKFAFNVNQILEFTKNVYTDKEVKEWSEKIETFEITEPVSDAERADPDYKPKKIKVRMTTAQIMSLYCLNKREQARGHLLGGGMRVADFEDGKKTVSQTDAVILTENTIAEIIGRLDKRQIEVADKLQEFLNTVCPNWGNEVSMLRFGYNAFGELNYFPIQSDENNLAVNDATDNPNSLFRLLNMSFSKALTEKADNTIVISNIFDVFAQHSSDMAKYNALALPVLDAFRWYNFVEKQQKGEIEGNTPHKTMSVKEAMEKAFGNDAKSYFTTFLRDINGTQSVSRDTLGNGFFTNAKIASVGANLRVVLLQPTSYLRANAVINPKYLSKALLHKPRYAEAIKHCGIALWKSLGYYDTNVQRSVEEQIKHSQTKKDKAIEWAMMGAEFADKITWGYLWNACEFEIRDTRKDLKVGSTEFYEAISKRLRDVIYATQVVDSTMTRSELMRSSDRGDKMLTAFASEPTLAYNMLYDAYMELHLDARKMGKNEAWKKNGKRIARIVLAYTVTNMAAALVEAGFDAFRDDDDEEKDLAYFMKLYFTNLASDMSITGKIPYIKEIHSIVKGFSSSRTDTQWMESTMRAIKEVVKAVEGEGNPSKLLKNSIKAFSDFTGLPFYNIYREANATLDLLTGEDLDEMFNEFFE